MRTLAALGRPLITLASLSMTLAACSSNSPGPAGAGGGNDASSSGDAPGSGGAPAGLFGDPGVPSCAITSSRSDMQVKGTVAGQAISMQQGPISNIATGDLQVLDSYLTDAGYQVRIDLELKWKGSLTQGVATNLDGGTFYLPPDQPGGGKFYCFSQGEFGPVSEAEQTGTGKLFKFRMGAFQANEDCSGGAVAGELAGCIYRLNTYLP